MSPPAERFRTGNRYWDLWTNAHADCRCTVMQTTEALTFRHTACCQSAVESASVGARAEPGGGGSLAFEREGDHRCQSQRFWRGVRVAARGRDGLRSGSHHRVDRRPHRRCPGPCDAGVTVTVSGPQGTRSFVTDAEGGSWRRFSRRVRPPACLLSYRLVKGTRTAGYGSCDQGATFTGLTPFLWPPTGRVPLCDL